MQVVATATESVAGKFNLLASLREDGSCWVAVDCTGSDSRRVTAVVRTFAKQRRGKVTVTTMGTLPSIVAELPASGRSARRVKAFWGTVAALARALP